MYKVFQTLAIINQTPPAPDDASIPFTVTIDIHFIGRHMLCMTMFKGTYLPYHFTFLFNVIGAEMCFIL